MAVRLEDRAVKLIGLGGIGTPVGQALAQFLSSRRLRAQLWLIDGDSYEERNRDRVLFQTPTNKAMERALEWSAACLGLPGVIPVPQYLTPRNAGRLIGERDIVFLCVDNHATRKAVSNRCARLRDVVLISGGNDGIEDGRAGTFGNVQIYIRQDGRSVTSPLTRFHPEIARPRDRRPDQQGCLALAASAPQLLFTNLAVAAAMLGAFYRWLCGDPSYEEVFLDIREARMQPVRRAALTGRA